MSIYRLQRTAFAPAPLPQVGESLFAQRQGVGPGQGQGAVQGLARMPPLVRDKPASEKESVAAGVGDYDTETYSAEAVFALSEVGGQ